MVHFPHEKYVPPTLDQLTITCDEPDGSTTTLTPANFQKSLGKDLNATNNFIGKLFTSAMKTNPPKLVQGDPGPDAREIINSLVEQYIDLNIPFLGYVITFPDVITNCLKACKKYHEISENKTSNINYGKSREN